MKQVTTQSEIVKKALTVAAGTQLPTAPKSGITAVDVLSVFPGARVGLRTSEKYLCCVCSLPLPLDRDGYLYLWAHECWTRGVVEVPDEEISEADRQAILEEASRWLEVPSPKGQWDKPSWRWLGDKPLVGPYRCKHCGDDKKSCPPSVVTDPLGLCVSEVRRGRREMTITWNCLICSAATGSPTVMRGRAGYWVVATECSSCASVIFHSKYGDFVLETENDFYPRA
jgi:hypothetical protein